MPVSPRCLRRTCSNCKGKLGAYEKPCERCQTPIPDIVAAILDVEADLERLIAERAPEPPPKACGASRPTHAEDLAFYRQARLIWERRAASGERFVEFPAGARKPEITLVRSLGFDATFFPHGTEETVFFIGPYLLDGAERGDHATEEAVLEFIAFCEHQAETAKLYLANGRNNKTHEWKTAR